MGSSQAVILPVAKKGYGHACVGVHIVKDHFFGLIGASVIDHDHLVYKGHDGRIQLVQHSFYLILTVVCGYEEQYLIHIFPFLLTTVSGISSDN